MSSAPPTLKDKIYNDELKEFLELNQVGESEEGNRLRQDTVQVLLEVFRQWVTEVGLKREIAEADCSDGAGARLFCFGSQRLGVHSPDADIDILCCAPQFVSRYDFFLSFLDTLKGTKNVDNILSLPVAYTPVIKFTLNGHAIDLVFVSLAMPRIPDDLDILDNNNLQKLDEAGIRSLNGVRVTERILKLVPDREEFCVALRSIKFWATRRGIYGNVLGFLGGVNYAILVAFVCQRFTNACSSTIIHQFFKIFSQWHWPAPVILTNVADVEKNDHPDTIRMPSWNPKLYPSDGHHLMPIITPASPTMNSAFNVCIPQFRMIQVEIQRALCLFESMQNVPLAEMSGAEISSPAGENGGDGVVRGSSTSGTTTHLPQQILWKMLFSSAATDFFQLFPRYIHIDVIARTAEEHRIWFGWCESRLRHLFVSIEQTQAVYCHPYGNCFHRRLSNTSFQSHDKEIGEERSFSSSFFIGLSFPERSRSLDLTETVQSFMFRVCSWVGKTSNMDLKILPLTNSDLPGYVYSEVPFVASKVLNEHTVSDTEKSASEQPSPVHESESRITHSGSTPQIALLALNSASKGSREPSTDDAQLPIPKRGSARIEKQLFSSSLGSRGPVAPRVNGSHSSGSESVISPKSSPNSIDVPVPFSSPLKTTRKEFERRDS
jgi:poly(A) polymerase